jgi:hypothetical protein
MSASTEVIWHHPYWVTFTGRPPACMEAPTEEAARTDAASLTGCEVLTVKRLPYPATPRLRAFDHPQHGHIPAFCINGAQCAGTTACPRRYSCVE